MRFTSFAPKSTATIENSNFSKYLTIDYNAYSGFIVDDIMAKKIERSLITVEKLFYPTPVITQKTKLTNLEKQKQKKKLNKKIKKISRHQS